jgi:hypothetical protein
MHVRRATRAPNLIGYTRRYPVSQKIDAETLYREHAHWMTRILPRVQRVLLKGGDVSPGRARIAI